MDRKIEGFSILEVLIVIAILSILMTVSISYYIRYKLDRELTRQANQLLNEISWVKSQSIAKEVHGIRVTSNSYTVFVDKDGDCNFTTGDKIVHSVNFSEGIQGPSSPQTFVFDRKGYSKGANCALGVVEGTITLKNSYNNTKNIKISRYGRTRIE
jgi:type IV fimbrial biogenesis protein FimT